MVTGRLRLVSVVFAFLAYLSHPAHSASDDLGGSTRPRIGLVLSGGGALGLAHIGVLQVLEEMRVPVDCVVGTSMGALVAGSYAAGVDPHSMQQAITATDINTLFDDDPGRSEIPQRIKRDDYQPLFGFALGYNDGIQLPAGASSGYKFELFLKELIGSGASVAELDFDQLPIPYRAVATDLENGKMKVFDRGELPRVMRASMSLPSILAPTKIDNRSYVDGGLVRNLPVDVGRELCGEVLIAVNLGTRPKTMDQVKNEFDVALQSLVLLTDQNVVRSLDELQPRDVLIEPELDAFTSSSFSSQQEIIERGAAAARANRQQLSRLSLTQDEYHRWQNQRRSKIPEAPRVTAITAEVKGAVSAKAVQRNLASGPGNEFEPARLHEEIIDIYGRGDFSYTGYSIVPSADEATIVIKAESKPWGPGYLKLGLGAASDFSSPTQLNLATSYRRTWINSLGGEWRSDAQIGYDSFLRFELFQPLQIRDGLFLSPYALTRRDFIQVYQEDIRLGDLKIEQQQAGLDLGVSGPVGEIRLGGFVRNVTTKPGLGVIDPLFPNREASQTGVEIRAVIDQLDSYVFPRSGYYAFVDLRAVEQDDDAFEEYTRAQLGLAGAISSGDNTLSGKIEWGDELSGVDDLPVFDVFRLGGPNRLAGLYLDQLNGTRYDLATLNYYHRYSNLPPQIGRGLYVGVSLESGRVDDPLMKDPWERVNSAAIYWGADTLLGAVYIGYGRSSLNQSSFYLVIGPKF